MNKLKGETALVTGASRGIGQSLTFEEASGESFSEVMNLNVKAIFFVIQQALPRLKDEGRIKPNLHTKFAPVIVFS